ncbi:MAG: sulfatase-like hydrolase/transferase, partial [Colwellia sp.]|nr:sulfatase-like hydrolase/transferase [Colwellia sp.]
MQIFSFNLIKTRLSALVKLVSLIALCFVVIACSKTDNSPIVKKDISQKPNIVFILVDDLGWRDTGVYGSAFYETPNIDKLAHAGTRFTDAYSSAAICSPTRAAIMTGKSPARLKMTDYIPGEAQQDRQLLGAFDHNELALEEYTIAEALKAGGYKTFFAGKWHLGSEAYYPEHQGFDFNIAGSHHGTPGGYYSPYKNPKLPDGPEGEYLTDRLTNETLSFISKNKEHPFFAYLSFYNVHTPLQAAKAHLGRFSEKLMNMPAGIGPSLKKDGSGLNKQHQDNATYASMIYAMDENVGRIIDGLADMGLDDNTIIIFTSDNGGRSILINRYGGGDATSNLPLRAGKGWLY